MITNFNDYQNLNEANTYEVKVNSKKFGSTGNYKDTLKTYKSAVDQGKDGDEVVMYKTKNAKGKEVNDVSKKITIGGKEEKKTSQRKGKDYYLNTVFTEIKKIFKSKKTFNNPKGTTQMKGIYDLHALKKMMAEKGFTTDEVDQSIHFAKNEKGIKEKLKSVKVHNKEYNENYPRMYWIEYTSTDEANKEKERAESEGGKVFSKEITSRKERAAKTVEQTKTRKVSTTKREYKDDDGKIITFGQYMANKRKSKKEDNKEKE